MRWSEITASGVKYWECVFVNVPFKVVVELTPQAVTSTLYLVWNHTTHIQLAKKECESVEQAKSEVESFVLDHLALYSAQVHCECLEANVMTWRKLREQLDQIPEHQLDLPVKTLDNDNFWFDTIEIKVADEPLYKELNTGENVPVSKSSHLEESEMVLQVVEEEPYLHLSL